MNNSQIPFSVNAFMTVNMENSQLHGEILQSLIIADQNPQIFHQPGRKNTKYSHLKGLS